MYTQVCPHRESCFVTILQSGPKYMQMHQLQGSIKKKVVQKCAFFFADSLSFDFNFKTATSECMPHHSFTSKHLHEYPLLFSDFRLDFLIGLQIKFDVHHRIIQKQLILQVRRLKNALSCFCTDISFEQTAYEVVLKSQTL